MFWIKKTQKRQKEMAGQENWEKMRKKEGEREKKEEKVFSPARCPLFLFGIMGFSAD